MGDGISSALAFEMGTNVGAARMRDATRHSNELGSVAVMALTGLADKDASIAGHRAVRNALADELAKLDPTNRLVHPKMPDGRGVALSENPVLNAIFDRAHDEWLAKNRPGLLEQLKAAP